MLRAIAWLVALVAAAPVAAQPFPGDPASAAGLAPAAEARAAAALATDWDGTRPVGNVIESIKVRGNWRTDEALILRELNLRPGDVLAPDDGRARAAELRLLSLGFFVSVQLRLDRGTRRGSVVLVVEVVERGTKILNALFLGTSEATALWGGLDVAETNLLGRGIMLGGGFLASTRPTVPGAAAARAASLRAAGPPRRGSGLALSGSLIYADGSEFQQAFGIEDEADPNKWAAARVRRFGGGLGVGSDLSRTTRILVEGRFEAIRADLPDLRTRDLGGGNARPLDFGIREGRSRLGALTATLDVDTRSDPVLPASGNRMAISLEAALPVLGSQYSYAKGVAQGSFYFPLRRTVIAFHAFTGAIFGDPPYFNQFFVADLNFLLPPRSYGLNFSTLPSRNFLGTSIEGKRYASFAGRALVEYAVPLWRRGAFFYRGDAFAAFGVFGLATLDDLRARYSGPAEAIPVDLTADLGIRLDTYVGIFTVSVANALGRLPF